MLSTSRVTDRPTWLRIDLDAIAHNTWRLRDIAGVPLMAVVKADAYGHGATRVARVALAHGAEWLAVATLGEACTLRDDDVHAHILALGYTTPWQAREAALLDVACTVFDLETAYALSNAGCELLREIAVHVKVDTGMVRLGLPPEELPAFLAQLAELPYLRVEGVYTHLATADSADETFARLQLARFERALAAVTAQGLRPPLVHAANSAACLRLPEACYDLVRPGIALYGLPPSDDTPLPPDFQPALSWHTEIAQIHTVPAGTPISYGGHFVTRRSSRIGTIPVGYADGFRRSPPWREVLVHGHRAPVVGSICMDYAMLDVTDLEGVQRGDPVVLIGSQGGDQITAQDVARWLGTIHYEVIATILARVPRGDGV